MNTILGIDPGLMGGLCFMTVLPEGQSAFLTCKAMPRIDKELDVRILNQFITDEKIHMAYLEYSPALHGKFNSSSLIKFGRMTGVVEGLLAANKIPYELVNPRRWQNEIFRGIPDKGMKPKDKSKLSVSRIFPAHDFRKSERSRIPHDGIIDATLIAEYGRRCLNRF
jgi:hypothetical protein